MNDFVVPARFRNICQDRLPDYGPMFPAPGLPGTRPVPIEHWLMRDERFDEQVSFRRWLVHHKREQVIAVRPEARAALDEVLALVLSDLGVDAALEKDGKTDPLGRLAGLVQEDICILQKVGDEHVLTAGLLCFPSSWSLVEKIGRPLLDIHAPVDSYSQDMGRRVQRMFDMIRPDMILCRTNLLHYADPCLYQPRTEANRRDLGPEMPKPFVRVERQTLRKLPQTGAVVFGIHSYVVAVDNIPQQRLTGLFGASAHG